MGFIFPQKPSFDVLVNGGCAAGEGCVVEGGVFCGPDAELPLDPIAPAGIASADASAAIASWLGNKFRTALDLIKWCLL
jgi:hypothetical protein